ncbi:MAG TPA: haloacid dehalogenase-like hydrolase [Capillimicrobium sp.]|jgi:phosphoglycolate phosphatase-like HAD superfamily hydrolase
MAPAPLLLLFDIDGTLLRRASTEHALALYEAMDQVFGTGGPEDGPKVEAAGRTDLEIARGTAMARGVPKRRVDQGLPEIRALAIEAYARLVPDDLSAKLVPGIVDVLDWLAARDDALLSLVTGNLEAIARLKLRAAGIGDRFPSGQGGFGSDSEDRTDLPPVARERAGAPGPPHPPERTIVIGDTPRDIACARADGLRVIAVTTGPYPAEALADADAVAPDARGLRELLAAELG